MDTTHIGRSAAPKDLRNEFAWSFSRERLFRQCERAFYWQYYGSWGGWEVTASSECQTARKLKQLKTLPLLVGNVIHEVIGRAIRTRPEQSSDVPADRLHDEADATFDRMYGETVLFEHYYKLPLSDGFRANERVRMHALLDAFALHPFARRLFAIPKPRILQADPTKFEDKKTLLRDTLIWGNPDVVVFDPQGMPHIIDWKTGQPSAEDPFQLAAYALFIHLKHGIDIRNAVGHAVYLQGEGSVRTVSGLDTFVDDVDLCVSRFVEVVKNRLTDVNLNVAGDIERFPMIDDLEACSRCRFQELCGRGPAVVPF